jgi:hypothetical protein
LETESREEMPLNSKILEEVKKRRGKPSPVNIYQRLVLLAGAAALVWAIWTSPALMPAVGVIGTTLLIFFVLKDSKEKQDKGKRFDPKETLPEAGENVDLQEMLPPAGENVDLQEMLPPAGENVDFQEMLPQAGENVNPQEMLPEVGKNVDLQEMLSEPEEKERAEKVV